MTKSILSGPGFRLWPMRWKTVLASIAVSLWISVFRQGNWRMSFQEVLQRYSLEDDAVEFMVKTYRLHMPDIRPREGIARLLEQVKRRDGVLGCITDGRSRTQRNKITALGLGHLFDVVLISEETGHGKPDPFNFQELTRQVEAREFWYIGDNLAKDFVSPNALGWRTIGVSSDRNIHGRPHVGLPQEWFPQTMCSMAEMIELVLG